MNKTLVALSRALASLYPDAESSLRLLVQVGVDGGRIQVEQSPANRWIAIVEECEKSGLIAQLIDAALLDYPGGLKETL